MIQQTPWFERKFNFDFPVGLFPSIAERLAGTPARLEELTRGVRPTLLTTVRNGKWSIQQHAGHLLDLEELHNGRIDDYLAHTLALRSADLTNKKTEEANHNSALIRNILHRFREGRLNFVHRLRDCDERLLSAVSVHPRLKQQMRLVDMAYFVAEHDDHHLARMRALMSLG